MENRHNAPKFMMSSAAQHSFKEPAGLKDLEAFSLDMARDINSRKRMVSGRKAQHIEESDAAIYSDLSAPSFVKAAASGGKQPCFQSV